MQALYMSPFNYDFYFTQKLMFSKFPFYRSCTYFIKSLSKYFGFGAIMNDVLLQFRIVCCFFVEYTWVFIYWLVFYKYANLIYMSPSEGNGNPLQYSCLENSKNRGARQALIHEVTKSWAWLSDKYTYLYVLVVFCRFFSFCLYIIIYSEASLSFSLTTVVCFHYFLPYCTCESFQSNVEKK